VVIWWFVDLCQVICLCIVEWYKTEMDVEGQSVDEGSKLNNGDLTAQMLNAVADGDVTVTPLTTSSNQPTAAAKGRFLERVL